MLENCSHTHLCSVRAYRTTCYNANSHKPQLRRKTRQRHILPFHSRCVCATCRFPQKRLLQQAQPATSFTFSVLVWQRSGLAGPLLLPAAAAGPGTAAHTTAGWGAPPPCTPAACTQTQPACAVRCHSMTCVKQVLCGGRHCQGASGAFGVDMELADAARQRLLAHRPARLFNSCKLMLSGSNMAGSLITQALTDVQA